jgi:hypothetical protein
MSAKLRNLLADFFSILLEAEWVVVSGSRTPAVNRGGSHGVHQM